MLIVTIHVCRCILVLLWRWASMSDARAFSLQQNNTRVCDRIIHLCDHEGCRLFYSGVWKFVIQQNNKVSAHYYLNILLIILRFYAIHRLLLFNEMYSSHKLSMLLISLVYIYGIYNSLSWCLILLSLPRLSYLTILNLCLVTLLKLYSCIQTSNGCFFYVEFKAKCVGACIIIIENYYLDVCSWWMFYMINMPKILHGCEVTEDFFDVCLSYSISWIQRAKEINSL